jgi:hypothetical protein
VAVVQHADHHAGFKQRCMPLRVRQAKADMHVAAIDALR